MLLSDSTMQIEEVGEIFKEEQEEDSSNVYILPKDCVHEIITRVETSVLYSCRRVCRSWRRLAYEPEFEAIRAERTAMSPGLLLGTLNHNELKYDFLPMYTSHFNASIPFSISSLFLPCSPQNLRIEATSPSHGLLFVKEVNFASKFKSPNYYITRLGATNSHRPIPNPKIRFRANWSAVVCDDNRSDEFKIVRIYESMHNQRSKYKACACEIFDSVTDKWRCSGDLPYMKLHKNGGIVINQTIYWMSQYADLEDPCFATFSIFAFDVNEEKGRIIEGPQERVDLINWPWMWEMIGCEDKLYLVQMLEEKMEVWMMTEAADGSQQQGWERKGMVSYKRLKQHEFAFEQGILDDEVVLLETLYREFWYQLKGMELIDCMNPPLYIWRVHMNVANLQSFNNLSSHN